MPSFSEATNDMFWLSITGKTGEINNWLSNY